MMRRREGALRSTMGKLAERSSLVLGMDSERSVLYSNVQQQSILPR